MIGALILVISVAAMLQFFLFYVRSLLAAYSGIKLSADACQTLGVNEDTISGADFPRLLDLLKARRDMKDEHHDLGAIRVYFNALAPVVAMGNGPAAWAKGERARCAWVAAVAMNRCLADSK